MYSLTIPEARSVQSGHQQDHVSSEGSQEETWVFQLLMAPENPWSSLQLRNSSLATVSSWFSSLGVSLCVLSSCKDMVIGFGAHPNPVWASPVAQLVRNLPAVWEIWVHSLGWEDPWRRERIPILVFWAGEFHGLYNPWGHKKSDTTERLSLNPV